MCQFNFSFGPNEVVELFRKYYGPTKRAFEALDSEGQAALRSDLEQLWAEHNQTTGNATLVDAEYLEVLALRA